MSNRNKEINNEPERNIQDMSVNEIFDEINKRNKTTVKGKIWKAVKWFLLLGPRMLGGMFGLDKETINSYSKHGRGRGYGYSDRYVPHPPSSSETFRDSYRTGLSPYTFNPVEADNLRQYLQGQDGRGDPPEHHCDHDR